MNLPASRKPLLQRLRDNALDVFTRPASAKPLAALRIGLAGVLLLQALALAGDFQQLYGPNGIVQRMDFVGDGETGELFRGRPSVQWVIDAIGLLNIQVSDADCTSAVYLVYVAALCGLLLGWRTPVFAFLTWGTHYLLGGSADETVYGVDTFAHIFLFYCIWMPTGHAWSVDRLTGRISEEPSLFARASLRVLQLHLCVIYLSSGIHKAVGADWWDGETVWRALNLREMTFFDFTWLADVPGIAVLLGLGTLAVEIGYAFLVWPQQTRKWMAWATIGLHLGIAVGMGLLSFSAVMIVFTASAFLVSPEPQPERLKQPVGGLQLEGA